MIQILKNNGWDFVSFVYADDQYGTLFSFINFFIVQPLRCLQTYFKRMSHPKFLEVLYTKARKSLHAVKVRKCYISNISVQLFFVRGVFHNASLWCCAMTYMQITTVTTFGLTLCVWWLSLRSTLYHFFPLPVSLKQGRIQCGGQSSPPKTYESKFIHHDFVQFAKQHSRYQAILPSVVFSQQRCEVYFISLAVVNP